MNKEASFTLEEIKKILQHKTCVPCKDNKLLIKEEKPDAELKSIKIFSVGQNAFYIKYDEYKFPGDKFFNKKASEAFGLTCACDAIAFCIVNGQGYILCCELKSSEPKTNDVARQFRNAQCFLIYLNSILKHYLNQSIENWQHRYFVFHLEKMSTPKKANNLRNKRLQPMMPQSVLYL